MAQEANMNLKIKCLKGDDFTLCIPTDAAVDDLKEEIVKQRNIEPTKQRLIYKGRVLKSGKKLSDYSISDQTTVHLIIRKKATTNPQNDEVTPQNSTATSSTPSTSLPSGATTAISVAVVDGSNGAADVNSILNSVLSGFGGGNIDRQALQNQIQSAMSQNPQVMNLRGLLNPGDNPNAPNDEDVSSDDDENNDNNNNVNNILPELQPQFAVSNGQGGYSPVTLLPPVLRSCNAMNLELNRLQRNYNRDVIGIKSDENDEKKSSSQNENENDEKNENEDDVSTNQNENVSANNTNTNANATNQNNNENRPNRREYLHNLLDLWERYNEIVHGQTEDAMDANMNDDNFENDEDEYKGIGGFIDSVFDELIDFQNTIESGLNNQTNDNNNDNGNDNEDVKDDDDDLEMKQNDDNNSLKRYTENEKEELIKKTKCAGNLLVEIGTVLASLGHMINKMDLKRKTKRNRLRITGLHGLSHVVRTAVPVEISTIVSRGFPMQQRPPQQNQQNNANATSANTNNDNDNNQNVNANTNASASSSSTSNQSTNTQNDGQSNNLLSSLLDSFAGTAQNNENNDNGMDVDQNENENTQNNNNNNAPPTNPMSALLNAFSSNSSNANGGNSNPLASLMSAFTGGANRNNANVSPSNTSSQSNNNNNNNRNPLMLIHRTIKFLMDHVSINEVQSAMNGNYSFIRTHWNTLRSFMQSIINPDTPMQRHEIAQQFTTGFGLWMISRFSTERRDVIRSLTQTLFRNHTPLLISIIMDSNSEIQFEQRLIEWICNVFSSWIYKLSLKYNDRLDGVKKMFVQLLLNTLQYLNAHNDRNKMRMIPQFVDYFVQNAKKYHLKSMQKQHQQNDENDSSAAVSNVSSNRSSYSRRNGSNEQWVMNVEETQRDRWLETIRCDQKRMKQSVAEMKNHQFSDNYLPPAQQNKNENDKQ